MKSGGTVGLPGLMAYGALGLPLALASLPLYVHLPQFYATSMGVPLALAGVVLLSLRLLAACADPLIGILVDRRGQRYFACILVGSPFLLAGFAMLFMPPPLRGGAAAWWMAFGLIVIYAGHGLLSIAHQSWGAALSGRVAVRSQLPAAREAFGLVGVILAAALAGAAGYPLLAALLGAALALSIVAMRMSSALMAPIRVTAGSASAPGLRVVAANRRFRRLFLVLLVSGTASAIPATLFLFFTSDYLQLAGSAPAFLIAYFVAAACSLPVWTRLAHRLGEARAWRAGMVASAAAFVWTATLDAGAASSFMAVCVISGLMLGADLALPTALLAGVIESSGHSGRYEAAYFGTWNWGVQLTLALAAGLALPLLQWGGYTPGSTDGSATLVAAYCLLPCCLKLAAAMLIDTERNPS